MAAKISNIVFTRNRPLQLEAYLESLYRHMPAELIQTYIVYKLDLFDEQYIAVFKRFSSSIVVQEKNFPDDLVGLLAQLDTKYVLFGTDDVVYYDSVDFGVIEDSFDRFGPNIFGFSLRLDPATLRSENDIVIEYSMNGETVYCVNWKGARDRAAGYPFELNSTVYKTSLVRQVMGPVAKEHPLLKKFFKRGSLWVRTLNLVFHMKDFLASLDTFHNPNAFESYCYRWCRTHNRKLPSYLCFQRRCASAIQVNRVNTVIDNPIDASSNCTVEALNEKYKRGYRLDVDFLGSHKPLATHVGRSYFRLEPRDQSCEQLE